MVGSAIKKSLLKHGYGDYQEEGGFIPTRKV